MMLSGDLHGVVPQGIVDVLGIVEHLDRRIEAFVVEVAAPLGQPDRQVEHRARHDGDPDRLPLFCPGGVKRAREDHQRTSNNDATNHFHGCYHSRRGSNSGYT